MNDDARPVTILFGDDDDDVIKPATKQRKIQNMELMLRTPTPFPIREPTMPRYILPPGEVDEREDKDVSYAFSSRGFHDDAEWDGSDSIETSTPRESSRNEDKNTDEPFHRMLSNRVKLEAFVNVGARLVIGDNSRAPSSESYTFEYNRPASRSPRGLAPRSMINNDLSARIITHKLSQSLVCSAPDDFPTTESRKVHSILP